MIMKNLPASKVVQGKHKRISSVPMWETKILLYLLKARQNLTAASGARQIRFNRETHSRFGVAEINADRFDFFEQLFFDHKCDASISKNGIIFLWLVQSHPKRLSASPIIQDDSDRKRLGLLFQNILDHFTRFFGYLKHVFLLRLLFLFIGLLTEDVFDWSSTSENRNGTSAGRIPKKADLDIGSVHDDRYLVFPPGVPQHFIQFLRILLNIDIDRPVTISRPGFIAERSAVCSIDDYFLIHGILNSDRDRNSTQQKSWTT